MKMMILLGVVSLLYACAKSPAYLHSTEERVICHKKFRAGKWYPVELQIPLWLVYRDHIGMHPNDYWDTVKRRLFRYLILMGRRIGKPKGTAAEESKAMRVVVISDTQ